MAFHQVAVLEDLGALDADEALTNLGELLSTLPIDPRLGKLLLLGAGFGVLDEVRANPHFTLTLTLTLPLHPRPTPHPHPPSPSPSPSPYPSPSP